MKIIAPFLALAFAISAQAADVTAKLSNVHLCCQSCVNGAQRAVAKVEGVNVACDKDAGTVTLTGPDTATVQKGIDALVLAGYFGKCADSGFTVASTTDAKDQKVQTLSVQGVHLCCDKCVKAVNKAIEGVDGVKGTTAAKKVKSFTVTGDFNDRQVFEALQKAGLTGKVGPAE